MMLFMVDETLGRLGKGLDDHRVQNLRSSRIGIMRASCRCGLHLLLTYYVAGIKALRQALPRDLGKSRLDIVRQFNRIAHDDMEALCGICQHRNGPECCLRPRI
jgi:hypothetical protein